MVKILLSMLFTVVPSVAFGQALCLPQATMFQNLARLGEMPAAVGRISEEQMMTILQNEKTGKWSMIVLNSKGAACLWMYGDEYDTLKELKGEPT